MPQAELRLYTLKLFKSQVPYCGRKWRQSNMRVITAIYLHCRPELRDDWLAGSDVDADVEEAVPLEAALRSLGAWWHYRVFGERWGRRLTAAGGDGEDDELAGGFFERELEAMGWGAAALGAGDGAERVADEGGDVNGHAGGNGGEAWEGGGPLQMEGW